MTYAQPNDLSSTTHDSSQPKPTGGHLLSISADAEFIVAVNLTDQTIECKENDDVFIVESVEITDHEDNSRACVSSSMAHTSGK